MADEEEVSPSKQLEVLKEDVDDIFFAFESILGEHEAKRVKRPSIQEKERLALLRQHLKQPMAADIGGKADQLAAAAQKIPSPNNGKSLNRLPATDAAMLVQNITEQLENISEELVHKVEESGTKTREAESRSVELQVAAENHKAQYERLQTRLQKMCEDMAVAKTTCNVLQQQVEEKNEKISRLNRENTVQLWEREKKRVLKESAERETYLMAELQSMRDRVRDMKDRAAARFRKMNEDLKREKMRADLKIREQLDDDDPLVMVENLQRQLYVADKRTVSACDEIKVQQKLCVGVIAGLKKDYSIVKARWASGEPSSSGDDFGLMLEEILKSAAAGTLDALRADLDTHYQALDSDITGYPKKVAQLTSRATEGYDQGFKEMLTGGNAANKGASVKLKPLKSESKPEKAAETTTPAASQSALKQSRIVRRLSATGSRKTGVTVAPVLSNKSPGSSRKLSSPAGDVIEEDGSGRESGQLILPPTLSRRSSRQADHPALINPVTGLPNIKEAVNVFPEMNDAQVRVHFSRFMTYDKNRDFTLDRDEVKAALNEMRDSLMNDDEFSAAFREIDTDGSGSLDFYEYLTLSRMLSCTTLGQGSFKETRRLSNRGQISKACVIQ